jgi:hypothetical protein
MVWGKRCKKLHKLCKKLQNTAEKLEVEVSGRPAIISMGMGIIRDFHEIPGLAGTPLRDPVCLIASNSNRMPTPVILLGSIRQH